MENKKIKYLILGGGVSGISTAVFLGKDEDYLILEKTDSLGGYCKTITQDGYTWDYSGHFFHFKDDEIKNLILKNIDKENLLDIEKKTGIIYKNKIISFPFQKNISELNKKEFIDCLYDFYHKENKKKYNNFLEWVYGTLGKSIVDKFVKPYNEKLYATKLENLDVNAMGRFFPQVSLDDIMSSIKNKNENSYNNKFLYPKTGAITYIHSLMKNVDERKISLNTEIKNIDVKNKLAFTENGIYEYDYLISSIPLNILLKISNQEFDESIYTSNKVVVFNLGFDKPTKFREHWLYVPDKKINFYRVGFYNNILGEDKTSLYVEVGYQKNKKINYEKKLIDILNDLKNLKIIKNNHKLVSHSIVEMNPAYIHLSKDSIDDSKKQLHLLEKKDIFSIGRYGEWTYCSIEDNILSAKKCVMKIKV